ncbi:hypothetical protein [Streptomyces albireticuli]|uniref:Secreted protein n=1 Tax=Streptomyces albireticuli TaxID=1940 RepID=A0A2A2D8S5_9ACTN|nr:hypothetical protein [Streptomyces albireticuli]MCD9142665.1 hypothetical protein [Streptomyces albireticuli]MCD9163016.1 hypothetical protein [Streptomyces albireticuli]MCD9192793.1 hypothetical protein [Streptomyces albireticuli]PAU47779.1 hypothetical protein CK936_16865 [Streptomyces albireticuli]
MSMRHTTKARRGAAAAALAAALTLTAAGCGGGDDASDDSGAAGSSATPRGKAGKGEASDGADASPPAAGAIGEMKGPDGVVITLTSARRDDGGFVTVDGTLTNRGQKPFNAIHWLSKETEMKSRSSLSGASLVDGSSKKRYLVLRDTDGECLCSTGLTNIKPKESRPVFAQFPAPPESVTAVDFQLPTMPSVRVRISG